MRIRAWGDFCEKTHWDHDDCQRFYCKNHRLLYRNCDPLVIQDDCPLCILEWEMKHEQELWQKDQAAREVK